MLMPYAASFTKAGVSPEEIEEAKQMLETDAWIRLDQIGSGWIRLDQIGSGWIRLDQIGLMVEAWHMARYGDKKQHYQPLPSCLEPEKRRQVIDIAGLVVSMPAQRKRNAPKKKKRQRTPVFLADGSSMVQYSNSGKQIPTTFLAMLQDSGEPYHLPNFLFVSSN